MKNHIIYGLLGLLTCLGAGCSDALDLEPQSSIGDNGFYNNLEEVEGAVIAIYDGWQQVPLREFALTEMRSDNTRSKSSEGDWAQFESFEVQPTNLAIGQYWAANYNVIFRANRVLDHLDAVNSAGFRGQFEGEARFSRALAHFNLVRAYGAVPIVDRVIIQTDSDYFVRDDAAAVLDFIVADLTAASALLPPAVEMPYGRASAEAAAALLGKVYLTQGNYGAAESVLAPLVEGGDFSLVEDYADVFYAEMNAEIIFAIPYLDDDSNESQDFSFEMTAGGVVSGLNYVTDDFVRAVDPADTERAAVLFNPSNPAEVGKFLTASADARLAGNDWIVLRYADVLLMYAEAIMGGNDATRSPDAIAAWNQVRERVGLSTLPTDGSEELTKEMLLYERRIELAFENHRFYDLIRFGVATEVLAAFAASENYSFSPTDLLLPIPQGEINVSQGLLSQNPGY